MPFYVYVHEANVTLGDGIDPAAIGAAVTNALCGHWDHDGPCRWPHNNHIDGSRFRTIFVALPEDEAEVRRRIRGALCGDRSWRVESDGSRDVAADEKEIAARLEQAPKKTPPPAADGKD